jgi:hypothetical protein
MDRIKIKTEKVWDSRRGACRRIIEITAAEEKELPYEYYHCGIEVGTAYCYKAICCGLPVLYFCGSQDHGQDIITETKLLTEKNFVKTLDIIRAAGQRLHEILQAQKSERESWKGTETFTI